MAAIAPPRELTVFALGVFIARHAGKSIRPNAWRAGPEVAILPSSRE
jgi:hypothetical protein